MRSGEASVNVTCGRAVRECRKLRSIIPGMTKKTVTLPSNAPVSKREVCVFSQKPKNVTLKSMRSGIAASNNKLRGGVAVLFKERSNGYRSSVNAKPA